MKLSKANLQNISDKDVVKPSEAIFDLPVKVLQFGTGVLLRGLPGYLIDKANRQGIFNGRILVVKSTNTGDTHSFDEQDGLYTLLIRGVENGGKVEENIICSSISQVLSAADDWERILVEAANPHLKVIVSNTTEVGIQLVEEDINLSPPSSFPAKILAFLFKRYQVAGGTNESGFVIIPTELLPGNGDILKDIILKLASFNRLDDAFIDWLKESNYFCNSLVDRIVPGRPAKAEQLQFEEKAGYQDDLLISSEVYTLWAIEGNEAVKDILSFAQADKGVVIAPDITLHRELKLRLLNGTHTLSCALAILAGFDTVRASTDDGPFVNYMRAIMAEISQAIPYPVTEQVTADFAAKVLDRFRNPYIRHLWVSISQQYSTKLKMRVVPVLFEYYKKFDKAPLHIAIGFAAYIVFMRSKQVDGKYISVLDNIDYTITDDKAANFFDAWQQAGPSGIALAILKDTALWGADLAVLPGFPDAVQENVDTILAGNISKLLS